MDDLGTSADADQTVAAHCVADDVFTIGEGTPEEYLRTLNDYLHVFLPPKRGDDGKVVCNNCGKPIDGMLSVFGAAVAYRWGLAHGEAECSGCGWPARGMHYIKDENGGELLTLRNFFLPYHPDNVGQRT